MERKQLVTHRYNKFKKIGEISLLKDYYRGKLKTYYFCAFFIFSIHNGLLIESIIKYLDSV